jgi:hypothetical protein
VGIRGSQKIDIAPFKLSLGHRKQTLLQVPLGETREHTVGKQDYHTAQPTTR